MTDTDLKKLGHLSRSNPHHKDWAPLTLYMQSQARPFLGWLSISRVQHLQLLPQVSKYTFFTEQRQQCATRRSFAQQCWTPAVPWRQVEKAAYAKHGGPDGLEEARLRRISTRTEARKKKRSAREAKARLPL